MVKMRPIHFLFIIAIFLIPAATLSAQQEADKAKPVQWRTLKTNDGEFSADMPSSFRYVYDQTGFIIEENETSLLNFQEMQLLSASSDRTIMTVEIYRTANPTKYVNKLIQLSSARGVKTQTSLPGFSIQQFESKTTPGSKSNKAEPVYYVIKYIASKDHIYIVTAANRGEPSIAAQRFLDSIHLGVSAEKTADEKALDLSKLTPITVDQIVSDERNTVKPPPVKSGSMPPQIKPGGVSLLILDKSNPGYTPEARKRSVKGVMRLHITFDKDGAITKIGFLSTLPNGLGRNAFFCALRIKFLPQEKDGSPTTATITIEYNFDTF